MRPRPATPRPAADPGIFDAADLLGLDPGIQGPDGGPRRSLTLAGGQRTVRLVVGSAVELTRFAPDALCAPPPFLDDLWRRLCVRALIRRQRGVAFLIDADALLSRTAGRSGESSPGGES